MTPAAARTEIETRDEFVDSLMDATLMATMVVGLTLLLLPVFVRVFEQSSTLSSIQFTLERERFQGAVVEKALKCNAQRKVMQVFSQQPYIAWATAVFYNEGPDDAYIAINQATSFIIRKNEVHPLDFTRADRRIDTIDYWCDAGKTASVRAEGKY